MHMHALIGSSVCNFFQHIRLFFEAHGCDRVWFTRLFPVISAPPPGAMLPVRSGEKCLLCWESLRLHYQGNPLHH